MKNIIETLVEESREYIQYGHLADFIPELQNADPNKLGVCIYSRDHGQIRVGDYEQRFTIQSISKPIALLLALEDYGIDYIKEHIGIEPTGKKFNALDFREDGSLHKNINPLINIGAIALCQLLKGDTPEEKYERLLNYSRAMSSNPSLDIDPITYQSEKSTGDRNRSMAYLLYNNSVLTDDPLEILEIYFKMCSLHVNCIDLANIGYVFAHHGVTMEGSRLAREEHVRFVNAMMVGSGLYDDSGDFATSVGIPAKSGSAGGIMGAVPNRMGIGIFSPAINHKGNSVAGLKLIEKLSRQFNLSVF